MRSSPILPILLLFLSGAIYCPRVGAVEVEPLLKTIRAVGPHAAGSLEAARAWKQLAQADVRQLPEILAGLDGAGPLAANWIRTAFEAVAERSLRDGKQLPLLELQQFVEDTSHEPRARRLAYECLVGRKPSVRERMIGSWLNDPSLELRRDAVDQLIHQAAAMVEDEKRSEAVAVYRRAFDAARDIDQVRRIAKRLNDLDQPVDLVRQLGFLIRWRVIGPFDNTEEKGYDVVYPPERTLDPAATHPGKQGDLRWMDHTTTDDYGAVDLNALLVNEKDVCAYAAAEFTSAEERRVWFRMTSFNAVKLWLNGRLIDQQNIYHAGSQMDQYVSSAVLRAGRNVILVKICQNAQTQDWADVWKFQLRLTDEIGGAIRPSDPP